MWNEGYVSEVDYVHGYFAQLAPAWLKLALLSRGIAHSVGAAPNYLELGFGQGLSLALHAAATPGNFYGVDFNPAQVANARELAEASGREVHLFEQSFEEFAGRRDLPEFDIIALHGVWSWVSAATRETIVRILRERLRAGGILYISYNTMPGWSPALPLRHLMHEYGKRGSKGRLLSRIEEAIGFAEQVIAADARYFAEHPNVAARLAAIRQQDRHYVSHEYFNRDWLPMSFAEVADMLADAKLDYAASANIVDNLDDISVPAAARPILDGIGDETLRQLTRDYFVNQSFRRDIFIKGARQLSRAAWLERTGEQRFRRVGDTLPTSIDTAAGKAELHAPIYGPIAVAIAEAGDAAFTIADLARMPGCAGLTHEQLWEAMLILTGAGYLAPASDPETLDRQLLASRRLNTEIIDRSRTTNMIQFLAAPRIGAAAHADRIELLFLHARMHGVADPVAHVAAHLAAQGEMLLQDGSAVQDPEQSHALLASRYSAFDTVKRPLLERLGAI